MLPATLTAVCDETHEFGPACRAAKMGLLHRPGTFGIARSVNCGVCGLRCGRHAELPENGPSGWRVSDHGASSACPSFEIAIWLQPRRWTTIPMMSCNAGCARVLHREQCLRGRRLLPPRRQDESVHHVTGCLLSLISWRWRRSVYKEHGTAPGAAESTVNITCVARHAHSSGYTAGLVSAPMLRVLTL